MQIDALYESIQEQCLPGLWSKGVALSRAGSVMADSVKDDEIIVRVHVKDRPLSPRVQLWPTDEDWFCDCGEKVDVCAHAAAAVIAVKTGQLASAAVSDSGSGSGPGATAGAKLAAPQVHYRLSRKNGALELARFIVAPEGEERLAGSLIGLVGGVASGRVGGRTISASREDFTIDQLLSARAPLAKLLPALKESPNVTLDGVRVQASALPVRLKARVVDAPGGFRVEPVRGETIDEAFTNGLALCGGVVRPIETVSLSNEERELLGAGRFFASREAARLVGEVLPALEKKIEIAVETTRLPRLKSLPPRVVLKLERLESGALSVAPRIVYGDPPIAEVHGDRLEQLGVGEVAMRDQFAEHALERRLQTELHLRAGAVTKLDGVAAVDFVAKTREGWDVIGSGATAFATRPALGASLSVSADGAMGVEFRTADGGVADAERVLRAWRENEPFVALLDGGFAKLPHDWLARYGERVSALLAARAGAEKKLPAHFLPELGALCEETGAPVPEGLRRMRAALESCERLPEARLPVDLRAELRPYQRTGVSWLCFLRESAMGAMLADDMGLGKTLQALCAIKGRTLIVSPTSVISAWAEQIEKFRPSLRYSIYHGGGRRLDESADVILTTYALLRLDKDVLTTREWGTVVLDEAQTIKNPESQVARAAHELKGGFRIALSGTPVENRLDDLWSQFQFLNPGLLGTRSSYLERFQSDVGALRRRIRPFVLRRLKRDVAPELPPRTETVLRCELSQGERASYEALLASTREEVVRELSGGGSVLKALEVLLRLRQACCHQGLIPGLGADSSSKFELLQQTLETSLGLGHRALIFSQWTSLLDLLEPQLAKAGVAYLRLDGSTPNRAEVVSKFQADDGPPVMLLSLKAGGVGLTLTAADHIFLMDPWWNPAVEDQAADRAHRIGQKNPVLIQRLVAQDTIEEKILLLQKKKAELARGVLDEGAAVASLTREDLLELLG